MDSRSLVGGHLGLGRDQANSEPTRLLAYMYLSRKRMLCSLFVI